MRKRLVTKMTFVVDVLTLALVSLAPFKLRLSSTLALVDSTHAVLSSSVLMHIFWLIFHSAVKVLSESYVLTSTHCSSGET